jgi:hypothetical protein
LTWENSVLPKKWNRDRRK